MSWLSTISGAFFEVISPRRCLRALAKIANPAWSGHVEQQSRALQLCSLGPTNGRGYDFDCCFGFTGI